MFWREKNGNLKITLRYLCYKLLVFDVYYKDPDVDIRIVISSTFSEKFWTPEEIGQNRENYSKPCIVNFNAFFNVFFS